MSKSLGNTVDPNKVSSTLGADILRLWVSSVDYKEDHRISDSILKQITEVYRKIRNTLRFFLGNLHGYDNARDRVDYKDMNELDRYAVIQLNRMIDRVIKAYESYDFHVVYQAIHHFCAVEMSSFYLDIIKDRLYVSAPDDPERKAAQTVIYDALVAITRLMAPILPHTADEVWKYIPDTDLISVQLADMPKADPSVLDAELENKWDRFMEVREEVFKALEIARQDKVIGNSLGASVHVYPKAQETFDLLAQFDRLDMLFIVSHVLVHEAGATAPEGSHEDKHVAVAIQPAEGDKCERCWIVTPEVGKHEHEEHASLCPRCADIVANHYV